MNIMNQEQNNQGSSNAFNQNLNVSQSTFNSQQQVNTDYQQITNQMNMQQPTPQPMNSFESENSSQNFNSKPPKKRNLGLIVGIALVVIAVIIGIFVFANNRVSTSGLVGNKNKLNATILIGGLNGKLVKTTNGSDWEDIKLPSNDNISPSGLAINGIDYVNGEYILYTRVQGTNGGMNNNTVLYKSSDGLNWELLTFSDGSFPKNLRSIEYINNNYYFISQWGALVTRQIYYGQNLNTTTKLLENDDLFSVYDAYAVAYAYGNDKFIVHVERNKKNWESKDAKTKYFYISNDGNNFEKYETDIAIYEMGFGNNVFVGVDAFETYGIYTSSDGINWTKTYEFDDYASDYGIVYRDNVFYVWYNDTIYTSNDGSTWKEFYKNSIDKNIIDFDYKNGVYAYTSLYSERNPKNYENEYSFKAFVSTDGKEWIESTFNIEDFDSSTLSIY